MTTSLKNQYEELIDSMMIDEVAGLDTNLKLKLQGLDVEDKRIGILSILDRDRGLFKRIVKKLDEPTYFSKTEHIKSVVEMMRQYVEVADIEKKTLGEVMTPISLVNDMLDTLPKEVWSNPNLKWLDPCGGCGIFSSVIIERLMVNLDISESDEDRYKHIVENMLYVSELQPKNMFLHLATFDPNDEYDLNVYCGSSLDEGFNNHMEEVWGIEKFDVIVMNPPYQTNKEGETKTHPIWDKFVIKTIDVLTDGGYLVAVHPSGWRDIDGRFKSTQTLLKNKQIDYLEIHNGEDGIKTFGAITRYDFYCVKNVPNFRKTVVKDENGIIEKIDLSKMEFIPNGMFFNLASLIAKEDEEKVDILHSFSIYETRKEWMNKEKTDIFKFPCAQNINSKGEIGLFYYSTTNEKGHFGVPKVIFGRFGVNCFVDESGDFGLSQDCTGVVDDNKNLINIKKAFESERFKILNKMLDTGGIHHKTLHFIPMNRKILATFRKDFWKEFI